MSDKNLDVDRAIASVGGERWIYHSFKPVLTNTAKPGSDSLFTYNELGEPEYAAAHLQLPPPSAFASPDDEYLEDAAYPEAHPNETWYEIPAPEDHTSRFIAPIARSPVFVEPAPVILAPVSPAPVSPAQVILAQVIPARSVPAPAPAPPLAAPPPRPAFAAPPVVAAKPPVYVPFLPSALPQASVHTSAQLYRPAERVPQRREERPVERSMELPVSRPQVAAAVTPPARLPPQPASPAVSPVVPVPPVILPMAPPPVMAPRPTAAPLAPPPPVMVAPPISEPAYRPALPPQRAPAGGFQGALPPSPAQAASTPYPQPFGTLADMYARLARIEQEAAAPAPPPSPAVFDVDEQKMFRRL